MAIISDGVHVTSTESEADLHAWAESQDIKRHWYHVGRDLPHYDIPKRRRGQDLEIDRVVRPREIVRAARSLRD